MNKIKECYKKYTEKRKNRKINTTKIILFFGFYFFFFLFLALFIKVINNKTNNNYNSNTSQYNTSLIENNNYHYKYTFYENDAIVTYDGYKNENNVDLTNHEYNELLDIYNIKKLIKNSKYMEKSNNYILNYEISTSKIYELLKEEYREIDSKNKIILYLDSNNNINKIELDFTNYIKEFKDNINLYKITIEYSF